MGFLVFKGLKNAVEFFLSVPEENIATTRYNATVIRGEMKAALLDGDTTNYDLDRGFTRHLIDDNNGQGIVIRLEQPYIINTVKLLLWDKDTRYISGLIILRLLQGFRLSHL